ncbi:hypothetical protein [Cytobacillus firmus]|uniref:hypothetical protein n=1 Tax=Cytobacillus firmus TaxID=1399 RepID=UPI002161D8FA|nr:hypothetical protein [Cytobacillus firmus]
MDNNLQIDGVDLQIEQLNLQIDKLFLQIEYQSAKRWIGPANRTLILQIERLICK